LPVGTLACEKVGRSAGGNIYTLVEDLDRYNRIDGLTAQAVEQSFALLETLVSSDSRRSPSKLMQELGYQLNLSLPSPVVFQRTVAAIEECVWGPPLIAQVVLQLYQFVSGGTNQACSP
jgi:hypothetical protein